MFHYSPLSTFWKKNLTTSSFYLLSLLLIVQTQAATAAAAVTAGRATSTQRTQLPLNDINIVALTDVHSWVAGHGYHEPNMNADYGHVLSFYQQLQTICEQEGRDLFFVMNGDFMDGTGLTTNPPSLLVPILEHMPWDALNIGNHELYGASTIDYISQPMGMIDHFSGKYITSNVRHADSGNHIGAPYSFLKGQFGTTLLTFGFLYDMFNVHPSIIVDKVEDVVGQKWFLELLREERGSFSGILILAHMDVNDPLVSAILQIIRDICGDDVPVQFITGHTHYRGFSALDAKSVSFEAGRYLDTVGFVSFNIHGEFQHAFLDANLQTLSSSLLLTDESQLMTPDGQDLSNFIQKTQQEAGLLDILACAPHAFFRNRTMDDPDSLYGLYLNHIVPTYLFQKDVSKVLIHGRGDFRYDLFAGDVTVTDLKSITPFDDKFNLIQTQVLGKDISALVDRLNQLSEPVFGSIYYQIDHIKQKVLPPYLLSSVDGKLVDPNQIYDLYTVEFHTPFVVKELQEMLSIDNVTPTVDYPDKNPSRLFLDFFQDNWHCSSSQNNNNNNNNNNNDNNDSHNDNVENNPPPTTTIANTSDMTATEKEDPVRLSLAVLLLGGGFLLLAFVGFRYVRRRREIEVSHHERRPVVPVDLEFDDTFV